MMPRTILLLVALAVFVVVGLAEAAPITSGNSCPKTHVDEGTQVVCTFSSLPAQNDLVVLSMSFGEYNQINQSCAPASGGSVVDSQGGSFTLAVESPLSTYNRALIWYRTLATAPSGAYSITATCPANSWLTVQGRAWSGLLTSAVLDQTGFASGDSASAAVQTSGTIGQGNQLLVAVLSDDLGGTSVITPSGGWTEQYEQETCDAGSGGHQCGSGVTQVTAIPGSTPSHAWTLSVSTRWASAIATFRGQETGGSGINRTLTWTDNANNELRFRVQKRTDQSTPSWIDVVSNLPPDTTQYIATIALAETGDCWRVWAENDDGSAVSNEFCPTTTPPPPPPPPPPPLTLSGLTAIMEDELL